MSGTQLIQLASENRVCLWVENGRLKYRSETQLSNELREKLIANRDAIIAALTPHPAETSPPSPPSPPSGERLGRMIAAADSFFERSGVPASHPLIVQAVAQFASALEFNDDATIRFAIAEYQHAVRVAAGWVRPH